MGLLIWLLHTAIVHPLVLARWRIWRTKQLVFYTGAKFFLGFTSSLWKDLSLLGHLWKSLFIEMTVRRSIYKNSIDTSVYFISPSLEIVVFKKFITCSFETGPRHTLYQNYSSQHNLQLCIWEVFYLKLFGFWNFKIENY